VASDASRPSDKLILVVDDEPDVLRYQAAILEDAGFEVVSAQDADQALSLVEERPPDLISLDLVMPGKSGLRFLHSLRRNRAWATIPVLIVTGHAHDSLGKRDLESMHEGGMISGPQVCLDKPVQPEAYVSAVMERLGLAGTRAPAVPAPQRDELSELLGKADPVTKAAVLELLRRSASPAPDAAPSEERERILIIDDEPDAASYLAALLEDEGYVTDILTDPTKAVEHARTFRPDVVTLDVDMPVRSGPDVYADLKTAAELAAIPVIVVTGVDEDARPRFSEHQDLPPIDGYLEKPVPPAILIEAVETALSATPQKEGDAMSENERKTILIVDDEEDVRAFLNRLLEDNDYATLVACDGDEALELVRQQKPDLVTLDLQMPNETGTQFYRRLRKEPELKDIPIIVISGVAGRHLAIGEPVAVFDKPIDQQGLLDKIQETLA
jgi:CheY-like chemotaxis protein